jgi:hypothetical protein
MPAVLPLGQARNPIQLASVIGLRFSIWLVTGVSTFARGDWEIQLEVDELKHQVKMRELKESQR